MAEAALSATEAALENQRIGPLQIRVAALCTLIQICDGYDINSVAWAVPSLTHVWNVPGPAFTTAFLWSSIGILVGALSAGPIGDRVGRKPLLLTSVTIFGLASLLSAFVPSILMLSILRFFTGLGIGGAFPGAATLAGDYAPHRLRATMIMATFTGAPLGGFIGGQIVALLLPYYGWPVIFILGGVFPLALVPVLALWLPEVLHLIGMTPATAVFASSLRDLGAIFAVVYLGLLIDRVGPERSLAFHYAIGAVFIAVISLVALPYAMLLGVIFLCGMTIIGSQTGANATCGKLYPARMRTSGLGWALGIGRLGGIAAPVLGGYLLSLGMVPTQIFLSACLFAVIAAAATGLLALRGTRATPMRGDLAAN